MPLGVRFPFASVPLSAAPVEPSSPVSGSCPGSVWRTRPPVWRPTRAWWCFPGELAGAMGQHVEIANQRVGLFNARLQGPRGLGRGGPKMRHARFGPRRGFVETGDELLHFVLRHPKSAKPAMQRDAVPDRNDQQCDDDEFEQEPITHLFSPNFLSVRST